MSIEEVLKINEERNLQRSQPYDPLLGYGSDCVPRKELILDDYNALNLPIRMFEECDLLKAIEYHGSFRKTLTEINKISEAHITLEQLQNQFIKERVVYDAEFWFASTCFIKEKISPELVAQGFIGRTIPFVLRRPQRKLLKIILDLWYKKVPVRIILLKARQWGGSTLVQLFFSWVQLTQFEHWNISVCAHQNGASNNIRMMYENMLKTYPYELLNQDSPIKFTNYGTSTGATRLIACRECTVSIGSANNPDSFRSEDINGVHLSEVGLFKAGAKIKPEDVIQALLGSVVNAPYTVVVLESTAKGVGNYFHREWQSAISHQSAFVPVFVSWFEIEGYSLPVDNPREFALSLNESEKLLFEKGATLENIKWYRGQSNTFLDKWRMYSEFPSDAIEAFQSTGSKYHNPSKIEEMRVSCCEPQFKANIFGDSDYGVKALQHIHLSKQVNGKLSVWEEPDTSIRMRNYRYVVVVDVNRGTTDKADNGVITVFDRFFMKDVGVGLPEVVAEWVGHEILRKFIWTAVQIAKLYDNAFLVIESNTPDSMANADVEHGAVLEEIGQIYDDLYAREAPPEQIQKGAPPKKYGFNTNKKTKVQVCSFEQVVIENHMYIERSSIAMDEHSTFEQKPNGSLGAVDGCHDDRYITRAIGNWICYNYLDAPIEIKADEERTRYRRPISSASV